NELKYTGEIKLVLSNEFVNPSPEFVRFFARQVYDGQINARVLEQFTELTKKSITTYLNERITERIKSAIESKDKVEDKPEDVRKSFVPKELPDGVVNISECGKIITTQEEVEGFYIVKSIIRGHVSQDRIVYRGFQNFFAILIDDSIRQCPCRLQFGKDKKQIQIQGEGKEYAKYEISNIDEIFKYSEELIISAKKYI
ncbi:MAG: restriction endonuclease, partial [Bacteroidales bacterium]|nr:restriction endonuclease [Bacteroidales bacterium]